MIFQLSVINDSEFELEFQFEKFILIAYTHVISFLNTYEWSTVPTVTLTHTVTHTHTIPTQCNLSIVTTYGPFNSGLFIERWVIIISGHVLVVFIERSYRHHTIQYMYISTLYMYMYIGSTCMFFIYFRINLSSISTCPVSFIL